MKTPNKSKSAKTDQVAKPKVKTELPLAEKDEIKVAEEKQRKTKN